MVVWEAMVVDTVAWEVMVVQWAATVVWEATVVVEAINKLCADGQTSIEGLYWVNITLPWPNIGHVFRVWWLEYDEILSFFIFFM